MRTSTTIAPEIASLLRSAPRLLYTRKDAAYQLSISVRSLDYLIASKQLATRRIGSRIQIPHEELVRLATSARVRSVV